MKHLLTSAVALALSVTGLAQAQTTVFTHGRVVTNTDQGILDNASVVVRDGVVVEVGSNVTIPTGANVIDAEGGWITPGLFHPYTQLGLIEVGLENSTHDDVADEADFTAAIDVADGFNPASNHIASTRLEGITRIAVAPSTGRAIIGGRGALANTSGTPDSLFASRRFMYVDVSGSGASTAGGSRVAAWTFLRAALEDSRFYPGRFMAHHEGDAIDRYDAAALVMAARGEIPLLLRVNRASDIRRALSFKRDYPAIRLILIGAAEAWMVADDLSAANIPVIMDPLDNLPSSFDALATRLDAAAILHTAGVQLAYTNSDAYFNPRLLPQNAGNAVAHGASWDDAFRAITVTPAQIYGVGDQYGALAAGYIGDVVVWDGDPLEVMSAPTHVMIDGALQAMDSRQTRLAQRYSQIRPNADYAYHHDAANAARAESDAH